VSSVVCISFSFQICCRAAFREESLQAIEPRRPEFAILQDPFGDIAKWFGLQAQRVLAPAPFATHQTRALQNADVLAESGERHREIRGHIGNTGGSARQAVDDRAPRRVRDGGQGSIGVSRSHRIVNHSVHYNPKTSRLSIAQTGIKSTAIHRSEFIRGFTWETR
jgi:hypothetical protein